MKLTVNAQLVVSMLLVSGYAQADEVPQFEITVLSAKVLPGITLNVDKPEERCTKVGERRKVEYGRGYYYRQDVDCEGYFNSLLNGTAFKPLPHLVVVNDRLEPGFDIPVIEVLTVVPAELLTLDSQIGFSDGEQTRFFRAAGPQGQTREAEQVTLKDGRVGIVHRFYAAFVGKGLVGAQPARTLTFKPVLVRQGIHHWDPLIGDGPGHNYVITNVDPATRKAVKPNAFDRREQVLK